MRAPKEGLLVVETLPYTTGPRKPIGVRQWKDEKKDEDEKQPPVEARLRLRNLEATSCVFSSRAWRRR